jgi:hypothetical protein
MAAALEADDDDARETVACFSIVWIVFDPRGEVEEASAERGARKRRDAKRGGKGKRRGGGRRGILLH